MSRRPLAVIAAMVFVVAAGLPWPEAARGQKENTSPAPASSGARAATTNSSPATATNATLHFPVEAYEVAGNTLLPEKTLKAILSKHTGTNITFADIAGAVKELQLEYHNRGYDTVSVTIPQQRLTNAVFRLRVFEGRLAAIIVTGNRYYSSNNVMRALPGLKTNMFLNSKLFQAELDGANANQDRQIYPTIGPGPETNTTSLNLRVKDRLPLHGKIEANNQSSPGTPEQRLNSSIAYDNLWQENHSAGLQYSFSEEDFKRGNQWNFFDRPLVANYSGFYRLPLAGPESMSNTVASHPGTFGYNEATRKFEMPPPSDTPELTVFGSRSTIDSGVVSGGVTRLFTGPVRTIDQQTDHQDLTVNEGLGFRLSEPLPGWFGFRTRAQVGADYKVYQVQSFETNNFIFTEYLLNTSGNPFTRVFTTPSPVPATTKTLSYLPLTLRWDANRQDSQGATDFGFRYNPNVWFSDGRTNVQNISGSKESSGYWQILAASLSREQTLSGEWKLALRADGQWASEPLIANEQFGVGGIAGVRGYREGEQFGDTGWRITSELKLPAYRIGYVGAGTDCPLIVRASVFMDYADTYLLDRTGVPPSTALWGTGIGGVATLGANWEAHLLFSFPLLSTATSEAYQLRVAFALSAQF
jgi:hemolysin activation/secretion protein